MLTDRTRLHIALQKSGRLSDVSRDLLRDAGFRIQSGKNSLTARVENFPAELMFVRDDDIPTFVSDGACEFGIVGKNVLEEFALGQEKAGYEELAELGFGRCSLKIAAPEATAYHGPQSLAGQRIATSYPHLAAEAGLKACQTAVMTHGGFGYAKEYHVERYLREIMIPWIAPVSPNMIKSYIAERVLGQAKSY